MNPIQLAEEVLKEIEQTKEIKTFEQKDAKMDYMFGKISGLITAWKDEVEYVVEKQKIDLSEGFISCSDERRLQELKTAIKLLSDGLR